MAWSIRSATEADVPGIRSVARAAWHEAHAPIIGTEAVEAFLEEHYGRAAFEERIERPDARVVVAVGDEGTILGYAFASPQDGTPGGYALSHIYVEPSRWGEGIGSDLLDGIESAVAEDGGTEVSLGVMAENERAIQFYEAAGYDRTEDFYDDRIDTPGYVYEKRLE